MRAVIAVLPGDGIGPEVVAEGLKVLRAVGARFGHDFVLRDGLLGGAACGSASCGETGCSAPSFGGADGTDGTDGSLVSPTRRDNRPSDPLEPFKSSAHARDLAPKA